MELQQQEEDDAQPEEPVDALSTVCKGPTVETSQRLDGHLQTSALIGVLRKAGLV